MQHTDPDVLCVHSKHYNHYVEPCLKRYRDEGSAEAGNHKCEAQQLGITLRPSSSICFKHGSGSDKTNDWT